MALLEAPLRPGSREQAADLVAAHLGDDLRHDDLEIDITNAEGVRPSFVDELLKQLLVVRGARSVTIRGASSVIAASAVKSAQARGVAERLTIS